MTTPLPPSLLEQTHEVVQADGVLLVVHRDWRESLPVDELLAGAPLTAWGTPVEHDLRGRDEIHVLDTPRGQLVAKAYRRGGIVGGVLRQWYADPWRPAREAVVAEGLRARGCPTPEVVAARATRGAAGLHRLEIATARLTDARDLLDVLRDAREDAVATTALARRTGRTLRRLHDVGLHHRDLQVKNLLVPADPDGPLVILDLDRCHLGEPLPAARRLPSLARFARSLVKNGVLPRPGAPAEEREAWVPRAAAAFAAGYGPLEGAGRGALLREITRRLRRMLRTHGVLWKEPEA